MRERYAHLMAHPDEVEDILMAGAARARAIATPLLAELREAVGLGRGAVKAPASKDKRKKKAARSARMVSFREKDGSFRFRLLAADGEELALSRGFADPKAAGEAIRDRWPSVGSRRSSPTGEALACALNGESVARSPPLADAADRVMPAPSASVAHWPNWRPRTRRVMMGGLALILLAPWLLILAWAYWTLPEIAAAHPRPASVRCGGLVVAALLAVALAHYGYMAAVDLPAPGQHRRLADGGAGAVRLRRVLAGPVPGAVAASCALGAGLGLIDAALCRT